MSLDGTNVLEFQGFKEHAGGKETLERVFTSSRQLQDVITYPGNTGENISHIPLDADGQLGGHLAAQKR